MAKRPIQADDLLQLRLPGDVRMAPDGSAVYWVEKYIDGSPPKQRSSLVRCPRGGDKQTFTAAHGGSDSAPRISPDGTLVAFLRTHPDRTSETRLCVMPTDGGEARTLCTEKGTFGPPAWSPDSQRLALSFRRADELPEGEDSLRFIRAARTHYKDDGVGYLPTDRFRVYGVDPRQESPALEPLTAQEGDWDDLAPAWSPDGDRIAFMSYRAADRDLRPEESDLFVTDLQGQVVQCTRRPGPVVSFSWSPGGDWIAAIGSPGPAGDFLSRNNAELFRIDPAGEVDELSLTADLDRSTMNLSLDDIWGLDGWGQPPLFARGGREVLIPVSDRGTTALRALDVESGDLRVVADHAICIGFDAVGDHVALLTTTTKAPGRIEHIDLSTGALEPVAWPLESYCDRVTIRTPIEFWTDPGDGRPSIQAWLLLPDGPGPHPLLLDIHGGPMCQFSRGFFHELQWLAAEGFAVLYANPRGSQGYGREFAQAIHRDWGEPPMDDLMAVVDNALALQESALDPARMGVFGGSYGGYMTNWIVGHTDRFAAACTQRTVAYLDAMLWSDFGSSLGEMLGGQPWSDPELYARLSPATYADDFSTPLLILQGLDDQRTPRDQGERLFVHLRNLGKDAELVLFPGGDHNLSRSGPAMQRIERLEVIREWFVRHLMPA